MNELTPWQNWSAVAESAAVEAGGLIRQMLTQPLHVQTKGYRDLVTDADIAAQKLITDQIRVRFPEHTFFAEEKNSELPSGGAVRWMIDPVDGTSNYSRGIPIFCVSIAVAVAEQVVVGVIYDPMRQELFSALRSAGATCNGQPLRVSPTAELSEAIIGLDWGRQHTVRQTSLNALTTFAYKVRSIRAVGSSALALAWVAAGRLDMYLNFNLSAWDIAAGALLIHEAGGMTSGLDGHPVKLVENVPCVASNQRLHQQFLALIQP
jgi:myo-inositol-1(or 4)-monophosphatase